ncbi:DUF7261 family protein [Halorussus salinisoli]|uniref:DUF7261 family protein n=1 Tax=Halorussus salinisoli TaxID=2558242 RepID=UPI0010C19C0F|nr:hypothetical protein [Halorussus salinisoli]
MADVRPDRGRPAGDDRGRSADDGRRDRGQLILVTGLAIAVMLVALVLLLNTVIYTQNLATRGAEVDDTAAITYQQEVVDSVGGVVDAENREGYDDRSKVEENVTAAIDRLDGLSARYHAEEGTVARVETDTLALTEGTLLYQTNASRNFTSDGESDDWELAEDVTNARHVRFTVSGENLSDGRPGSFHVRLVGDDGTNWRVYLYNDTDDDVAVAVQNGTDTPELACTTSGPEATVDLTRGTLNGSACPKLVWATDLDSPYRVEFQNADEAIGTYELTADESGGATDVETGNFAGANAEESPRAVPAVYAAEFDLHFETPDLTFHTTVRVARGEPE